MSEFADKAQTIEALRVSAEELLRHINEVKAADAAHRADAEANLYADAVVLRRQSTSLEQALEGEVQVAVYLGG